MGKKISHELSHSSQQEEGAHGPLLRTQCRGYSLPYSKAALPLAVENIYNLYEFHPDNGAP